VDAVLGVDAVMAARERLAAAAEGRVLAALAADARDAALVLGALLVLLDELAELGLELRAAQGRDVFRRSTGGRHQGWLGGEEGVVSPRPPTRRRRRSAASRVEGSSANCSMRRRRDSSTARRLGSSPARSVVSM